MSASASTTTAPPSTYTPTTIPNNTYYIAAQSFGVVIEFPGASGNLSTYNFTGDTSQQWQVTGSPALVGHSAAYTFKNVRYNNYISCVTPPRGYFYLSQSHTPCTFYARGSNGGYLFSPDPGLSVFWDVGDEVDVVILEPLASATVLILAMLNESSSLSSSATAISSSGRSGPSVVVTTTPSATATANAADQTGGNLSETNKISLGVGIGIGIPSFLVAVLSAWIVFRYRRRRKKQKREPEQTPVADGGEVTTASTNSSERVEAYRDESQESKIREDHPIDTDQEIGATLA